MVLLASSTFGQGVEFGVNVGYGGYSMTDLKSLDDQFVSELPFPAQITDNFPSWWNYGGFLTFGVSMKYRVGLRVQYFSTGSKISSKDYSGEYEAINTVQCFSPGMLNTITLYRKKGFEVIFNGIAGFNLSYLTISESLQIYDTIAGAESKFHSLSLFVEPEFGATYSFLCFKAGFYAGYMLDIGARLRTEGNGVTDTKCNWSGYRVGITLAFSTANLKKEKSKKHQDQ